MRIYRISPTDNVRLFDTEPTVQIERVRPLGQGRAWEADWPPLAVSLLHKSGRQRKAIDGDLSAIGAYVAAPVFSARAQAVLAPMLGAGAQWLALTVQGGDDHALLNLLTVIDALDPALAVLRRLPDGRVMDVDTYAFRPPALQDLWLFKVPEAPFDVLASDAFRERITSEGLVGFHFQPVWDSAHAPFKVQPGRADIARRPDVYGPQGFVTGFAA